jgi:hypothetical protein
MQRRKSIGGVKPMILDFNEAYLLARWHGEEYVLEAYMVFRLGVE